VQHFQTGIPDISFNFPFVGEPALDVSLKTATEDPWILAAHRLPLVQKERALWLLGKSLGMDELQF
jgi:hypothetical protein